MLRYVAGAALMFGSSAAAAKLTELDCVAGKDPESRWNVTLNDEASNATVVADSGEMNVNVPAAFGPNEVRVKTVGDLTMIIDRTNLKMRLFSARSGTTFVTGRCRLITNTRRQF
jgi:hypothetical protein